MPDDTDPNACPPSTTWDYRHVKIRVPPEATSAARRRRSPLKSLRRRDAREPLSITVLYRGGAEAWWEIRARGVVVRRPGHLDLHAVLWEISQGNGR